MNKTEEMSLHVAFCMLDTNGNGSIGKEDCEEALNKIATYRGWDETDPEYQECKEQLEANWAFMCDKLDANNDGRVSFEEFLAAADANRHNPEALDMIKKSLGLALKALDSDGDGELSREDFQVFLDLFNVNDAMWHAADTNRNGKLSCDEITALFTGLLD